jgi:hypothetical protein
MDKISSDKAINYDKISLQIHGLPEIVDIIDGFLENGFCDEMMNKTNFTMATIYFRTTAVIILIYKPIRLRNTSFNIDKAKHSNQHSEMIKSNNIGLKIFISCSASSKTSLIVPIPKRKQRIPLRSLIKN